MKKLMFMSLMAGMFLAASSSKKDQYLYQVISSHPHDVEALLTYTDTIYKNGRLWIVKLNENAPTEMIQHLKPLDGGERSYLYKSDNFSNVVKKLESIDKSILNSVDKEAIRKDVEDLANNYQTRYAGTEDNRKALNEVSLRFKALGYEIREICYRSGACSLIAEKKGSVNPGRIIMVEGHIDSVGEAFAGTDDNASGVAVILEMARVLKDNNNRKTLRFFIANGEELGLQGSEHYAKFLASTNEIKNLDLVINMDMVGYNSNGVVELETAPEHEGLAKWFADLATRYTNLKSKITLGAWGSDHVPFLRRGVPTMLTIENWDTKTPCYHLECDKPGMLNYEYATQVAKLNVSAVLAKDLN